MWSLPKIKRNTQREGGSALLVVMGIMVLLSVLIDTILINYDAGSRVFDAYTGKKQAFYMSEGVRSIVTVLVEQFMMNKAAPTGPEISTYLNTTLPPLLPTGYGVSPIQVNVLKMTPNSVLTSGPFKGMSGPVTDLSINFTLTKPSTLFAGNIVEPLDLRLSVGYISMFQFMTFWDIDQALLNTGPPLNVKGRAHANGDLCVGGTAGWESFLKVTVGKRFMNNNDSRCIGAAGGTASRIATDSTFTTFADITPAYDNGCVNCNNSGLNWDAFAIARWHEQVLDQAQGVQILKLPGAGMGLTQTRTAGNWSSVSNNNNLRFIVDPVLATDSASTRSYKYANYADIRIINGTWFIKDPVNPSAWPGLPIWSDHPGSATESGFGVGQVDLATRWSWPTVPKLFSYYEYDNVGSTLMTDPSGVISYGNLFNSGAAPTPFKPGQWVLQQGASALCFGQAVSCSAGACGFMDVFGANQPICPTGVAGPGRDPGFATNILNATRGGFRNGHINDISPGSAAMRGARANILPVNFDMKQFQVALASSNPGELGSYFGPSGYRHAVFNGVIYISSEWPGSLNGFGGGAPVEPPPSGSLGGQAVNVHPALQNALPQPLCSNAGGPTGLAGQPFDSQGPAASAKIRFNIPDCAGTIAYPNAIRVINGANLDPLIFPKGLSFVSNLPLYLTGDYNTGSDVSTSTSAPWVSSLIAGDKVGFMSNAWTDALSRWDWQPSATNRVAADTTYNTAMLSEPTTTLTLFFEEWTNRNFHFNGSLVFGYQSVYALHENSCCGWHSYDPPDRFFNFDQHFSYIANQPPGTPVFPVAAVGFWAKPQ